MSTKGKKYMEFNEIIQKLQKENGLTKKEVYEKLGVSNTTYWEYEKGTQKPTYDKLIILADLYNVSLDYLVGRTHNPEINHERLSHGENVG